MADYLGKKCPDCECWHPVETPRCECGFDFPETFPNQEPRNIVFLFGAGMVVILIAAVVFYLYLDGMLRDVH